MTGRPDRAESALCGRLRAQTADAHRRVESLLDLDATTRDLTAYGDHLGRLFAAVAAVERAIVRSGGWRALGLSAADGRRRLRADLAALGRAPTEPAPWPLPAAQIPGAVYVLEGSALGGGVVGDLVAAALPRAPRAFLRRPPARRWRAVRAAVDRVPPDRWPDALAGAVRTFALFEGALVRDRSPATPGPLGSGAAP